MKKSIFLFFAAILCAMTANAYNQSAKDLYFDNSEAKWEKCYVYIGHSSWTSCYDMTRVAGTQYLWKLPSNFNGGSSWNSATGWVVCKEKWWASNGESIDKYTWHGDKNVTQKATSAWVDSNIYKTNGTASTKSDNHTINAYKITSYAKADYAVTINTVEGGTLTVKDYDNNVVTSGASKIHLTVLKFSAAPADGYVLDAVEINDGSTTTTIAAADLASKTYTLTSAVTITPVWHATTSTVTVTATATNGTVAGDGVVEKGATVTLTATPADGYKFINWTVGGAEVSTANPYTFTAEADVTVVANFEELPKATIYFINNGGWSNVNVYAWEGAKGANPAWPGAEITANKLAEKIAEYDVYSYTVEQGSYGKVIFNNGSGAQTQDYVWTDGNYYWHNEALNFAGGTKAQAEEKLSLPVEYDYVYLINTNDWAKANIYTWTPEVAGWPGAAMTKEAEQIAGKDVYSYKVVKGTTFGGLLFNNGDGKTGDLTWQAGKYYAPSTNEWYADAAAAEAALATPAPTYDYYVVGTFNSWNEKDPNHGMTLDGEVYKATVTLATGANELKVTNGTWDNAKGINDLAAEYVEVSAPVEGDNIVITLAEGKDIVVVYNATTGKVTFEGLTEKLPAVITYVLMGVNNDWTTGIPLVRNEENTEYEEYMLLGQEILAGDAVKVVTLTDGVATAWCGNVDVQSIELLGVTFDENGNVVLAPGKYDFYYKVADNGIYIAGEAYPVEPELPAASVRAWAYDLALAVEGEQYTFSYKATTAALATLIFTDGEGVELATVELGLVEAGANSVVLAKSELPLGKKVNWAVKLEAGAIENLVEVTDQSRGIYDFYNMMDVLVDNNPESEYFGKIYIQMAYNGASDGATDRADVQTAGLFIYDQELNELNNPSNVGIKPTLPAGYTMGDNRNKFHRLDIDPKTGKLAYCYNVAGSPAVFAIDRANLTGEVENLLAGVAGLNQTCAHAFDAEGTLYVMNLASSAGTIYKVVDGQAVAMTETTGKWINASMTLAADGMGGLWVAQNRGQLDTYYQLAHVTKDGVLDYTVFNGNNPDNLTGSSLRGALAYDAERQLLAQGRNGKVEVYSVAYDAETGVPALTLVATTPTVGNNIDGLHFDYAGDLYVVNSSKEKFQKFAMPTETNVCTTPAASKYAFQNIEYDTMEITMTNLEVAEMMGYLVLTASDEMETGLNVMLALNEDGSVSEMSYASIISGWMETELPIVEGNITKTYSEELATDVYSGLVVVENMGGYLGLQLTMYAAPAAPAVDVVATDANIYYDEYGSLCLSANWNGETLNISGIEVSEEPSFMMIEEIFGEGEEDWYIWMSYAATATVEGNVLTIAGEFVNNLTRDTYNVTITGTMPQGTATDVDNLNSSVAPVKMLKNGQVIIIKNGVQYSVQGQVIK